MKWLRTAAQEVFGLFVDDGSLALGILVWTAVFAGLQHFAVISGSAQGLLLFAGFAALLLENIIRSSRK